MRPGRGSGARGARHGAATARPRPRPGRAACRNQSHGPAPPRWRPQPAIQVVVQQHLGPALISSMVGVTRLLSQTSPGAGRRHPGGAAESGWPGHGRTMPPPRRARHSGDGRGHQQHPVWPPLARMARSPPAEEPDQRGEARTARPTIRSRRGSRRRQRRRRARSGPRPAGPSRARPGRGPGAPAPPRAGHWPTDISTTTAAATAMAVITTARIRAAPSAAAACHGRAPPGYGATPGRRSRTPPRRTRSAGGRGCAGPRAHRGRRQQLTMPSPATTRASAVRFQARNVRSLARVNRASGSIPASGAAEPRSAPSSWPLVVPPRPPHARNPVVRCRRARSSGGVRRTAAAGTHCGGGARARARRLPAATGAASARGDDERHLRGDPGGLPIGRGRRARFRRPGRAGAG